MDTNSVAHLQTLIETLRPNLPADQLESWKREARSVVERLAGANGNGNGHGSGVVVSINRERLDERLSPREREVMSSLLIGRRLKEIAANLDISVKTVTTHRARLLRKLRVEDNLGLYRYGIRNGLITA
jgi:DNA-binding CsgD family transcriptional regulator